MKLETMVPMLPTFEKNVPLSAEELDQWEQSKHLIPQHIEEQLIRRRTGGKPCDGCDD